MGLEGVAAAMRGRLDEVCERMAARLRAELTPYADEALVSDKSLRKSCERNVRHVLTHFISGDADVSPARQTGRIRAEQGVPLADTLHAYRLGFELLWSEVLSEARAHPEVTDADLVAGSAETWALFGRYAEAVAASYREATVELARQCGARRSALVEALITGAVADQVGLSDFASRLGLPDRGPYVVAAAAVPTPGVDPLPGIESALRAIRVASCWQLRPDLQVGIIALADGAAETECLRTLRCLGARVGVSPRFEALRDAPQALRFARLALDGMPGDAPGVARFDDRPLAMLIAAAPDEAARLVKTALGPMLELPELERARLVETLEHWFAEGGSAAEAARLLCVHPNTVRYRLRRIEELTGRSLTDPAALCDLGTALHASRMLSRSRRVVDHW